MQCPEENLEKPRELYSSLLTAFSVQLASTTATSTSTAMVSSMMPSTTGVCKDDTSADSRGVSTTVLRPLVICIRRCFEWGVVDWSVGHKVIV